MTNWISSVGRKETLNCEGHIVCLDFRASQQKHQYLVTGGKRLLCVVFQWSLQSFCWFLVQK